MFIVAEAIAFGNVLSEWAQKWGEIWQILFASCQVPNL
jgi:hypothetical protein